MGLCNLRWLDCTNGTGAPDFDEHSELLSSEADHLERKTKGSIEWFFD